MIKVYLFYFYNPNDKTKENKAVCNKKEPSKRVAIVNVKLIKERSILYSPRRVNTPEDIVKLVRYELEDKDRECCLVVCLTAKNEPVNIHTLSVGSLSSSIVHPREVFKVGILSNAYSIVLIHNHPSGDSTPSKEDKDITTRIKEVSKIIGIHLVDHIIVGDNEYTSLKEIGYL